MFLAATLVGWIGADFVYREVKRPILHQLPNFVKIGQTVADISQFLRFFKIAAAAILNLQKFEILTVAPL